MIGLEKTVAVLVDRIDRMKEDRKEDREAYKQAQSDLQDDFKSFLKEDFKGLRDDVAKLRLNWAKIVGAVAVISVIITIVGEFIKAKLGA